MPLPRPRHPSIARALGELRRTLFEGGGGALGEPPGDRWIRGERLLVACSGGPDSVALLGLLELVAAKLGLELAVAHVDHGLREGSAAEAEAVVALARGRGHRALSRRLELAPGAGLPARARDARRAALVQMSEEAGCRIIALGHTATDQAETVLMHVIRGAGLDGLAAMPARDPEGPAPRWIRPLLGLTRGETAALCETMGLPVTDDPTNHDRRHLRVELREELLPRLRAHNPAIERSINALAAQAADAEAALLRWSTREEAARRREATDGRMRWDLEGLAALPRAVRTRILRIVLLRAGADRQALGERAVGSIDRALLAREAARADHGAALRPHSWDLRPHVRVGFDRSGLWALRSPGDPADNH
ncbi:MAG: tRNA lysidine(34) synthetase TilS [Myxococcales bacterium]|nr:tRNA lysidine(34) synthetase TilS [Myxococcales bacterium]